MKWNHHVKLLAYILMCDATIANYWMRQYEIAIPSTFILVCWIVGDSKK